jgi:hypothetical protein
MFSYIVISDFTKETFDEDAILGLRSWRRNIGHSIDFMDDITEVTLASRVCNNDLGLELSASQANYHQLFVGYIQNGRGSLMCMITILMWLLTVVKELSSTISFYKAICLLPKGNKTVISEEGNSIVTISLPRKLLLVLVTSCRFAVVVALGYAGTAWLANTVSVNDLILNAVALEFVLCVDEIIFEALAPRRLKCVVEQFASMPLAVPKVMEWKGLDAKSFSLSCALLCTLLVVWFTIVTPFEHRLKLADDALCAGELDFVYTIGKTGIPAWSKSSSYKNQDGTSESFGMNNWNINEDFIQKEKKSLNFIRSVADALIDGYGMSKLPSNGECGDIIQFRKQDQTVPSGYCITDICEITFCEAQYYIGMIDLDGNVVEQYSYEDLACCVTNQIKTPNIQGGRFSMGGVKTETVASAMDIWNPSCTDLVGELPPYEDGQDSFIFPSANLMASALSDLAGGTCGICPGYTPFCDPELKQCINISCADLVGSCLKDSTAGVRARQFCPITCNCHNPSGQLVLTSPDYGCPINCAEYSSYDEAVSVDACEDQSTNSSAFIKYLNEVTTQTADWPQFWQEQWEIFVYPLLSMWGCVAVDALKSNTEQPQNFCIDGGSFWPIKPLTYLCPVTCGCESDMTWGCPSSCAVNATYY